MSLRRVTASTIVAGVSLPCSPASGSSLAPLEKNSGAPHSSVATCASWWQMTLW
jgi:hypothetical protein